MKFIILSLSGTYLQVREVMSHSVNKTYTAYWVNDIDTATVFKDPKIFETPRLIEDEYIFKDRSRVSKLLDSIATVLEVTEVRKVQISKKPQKLLD